jgi:hypothetical protein
MIGASIPEPGARFRPIKDSALLSRLVSDAWQAQSRQLTDQMEALGVCEAVTAHLEARYPAEDMAILAQYGVAKVIERIDVCNTAVRLTRPVPTPTAYGAGEVIACATRFSQAPDWGLKPDYRATLSDAEFAKYCAGHLARERDMAPQSVDPYFARVKELRAAYQAEYRQATQWPAEIKRETGAYPTWAEIAARFPVLRAHIEKERAS